MHVSNPLNLSFMRSESRSNTCTYIVKVGVNWHQQEPCTKVAVGSTSTKSSAESLRVSDEVSKSRIGHIAVILNV